MLERCEKPPSIQRFRRKDHLSVMNLAQLADILSLTNAEQILNQKEICRAHDWA